MTMARIAFLTWAGGGNVPPAVGLARALAARGHDVELWGYEAQRASIEGRGLAFAAFARSGGFDVRQAPGEARVAALMRHVAACPEHLEDVPDLFARRPADALVVDCMMVGAITAAVRAGAPTVVLVHSAVAGIIPPPDSPVGAVWVPGASALRARVGLPPLARIEEAWTHLPTLVTTIAELDLAAASAPSGLRYVGPIGESPPGDAWTSPWSAADARPLVLASFSTTGFWDQTGRARNTLAALAEEPVRVLVTGVDAEALGPLPANAAVRAFVPHARVAPHASVTVTHCGHGTLAASLAAGVPVVGLPNRAADQPYLARRLADLGAGIALDGDAAPAEIRAAVRAALDEPSYRAAAHRLAAAVAAAPGAAGAAADVERVAAQKPGGKL
jgi:UDP:flavonoid glycosyltransferase YjiC (YdhE family)